MLQKWPQNAQRGTACHVRTHLARNKRQKLDKGLRKVHLNPLCHFIDICPQPGQVLDRCIHRPLVGAPSFNNLLCKDTVTLHGWSRCLPHKTDGAIGAPSSGVPCSGVLNRLQGPGLGGLDPGGQVLQDWAHRLGS